ncbi:MAG: sulfite oxidase [Chloroflexi bacterium]|nr:MAG: sulfite oxidase [Chloroflexota bacterium]
MATHQNAQPIKNSPLVVIREDPFNAETRLEEHSGNITPTEAFYVRNHFSVPHLDSSTWRLKLDGAVEQAQIWSYEELLALPSRTLVVTLECAGNGRSAMTPQPPGEPWQYGAVSTAEWTGVPLAELLRHANLASEAVEVVAEGADSGFVDEAHSSLSFARSLPLTQALHADTLVAYAMNGRPLTIEHGYPARLIVPGWYGVASVKWLTRLTVTVEPFLGFYQAERYIMVHRSAADPADEQQPKPLTTMAVRSLLISPVPGSVLPRGEHRVHGLAWSGAAPITRVEVSSDGGTYWEAAELIGEPAPHAWRQWQYHWQATNPGRTLLQSRAFDAAGNSQPLEAIWNELGYANNAIQCVDVEIY